MNNFLNQKHKKADGFVHRPFCCFYVKFTIYLPFNFLYVFIIIIADITAVKMSDKGIE